MKISNGIKIYYPEDIFTFGKHEGSKIKEVYKYEPSYIFEFCIIKENIFCVDMKSFLNLPRPTPLMDLRVRIEDKKKFNQYLINLKAKLPPKNKTSSITEAFDAIDNGIREDWVEGKEYSYFSSLNKPGLSELDSILEKVQEEGLIPVWIEVDIPQHYIDANKRLYDLAIEN